MVLLGRGGLEFSEVNLYIHVKIYQIVYLKYVQSNVNYRGSQVVPVVKNLPANAGDTRDTGSIPGLGRSPGGGNGNPLQYSCLENPMDRGAWWATVHGVTKSQTWLKWLSSQSLSYRQLFATPWAAGCQAIAQIPVYSVGDAF